MPSWDVHEAVSRDVFGISEDVARRVNEIVDAGSVHDLGRRLPGEPRISLQLLNPEEAEAQMRKLSNARKEVREIMAHGSEWARAFWLHHVLDTLSYRLVAAYAVGADLEKHGNNILEGVCSEFEPLTHDPLICGSYLEALLEEFKARFREVLNNPGLKSWAMRVAEESRKVWSTISAQSYLNPYIQRLQRKRREAPAKPPEGGIETMNVRNLVNVAKEGGLNKKQVHAVIAYKYDRVEDAYALMSVIMRGATSVERDFMCLMYRVSYYAARRSSLLDYALLTPFPWEFISETTLRVTKRRAAALGRYALEACRTFKDDERRRARIIERVHAYERGLLLRHGISLPQWCATEYADSFVAGYETVISCMQDPYWGR